MNTLSEIKQKMDSGNTILVAIATENLVNIIKSKIKGTRTDMTNIPEMLLLQEYCCHENPIICTTAFQALCIFMTTNNYQNQLLIDWLVVLSPQIKCKIGFIQEIFELIAFWLKNDKNINDNKFIYTLVDLLIKIMEENLDEWSVILFHMNININIDGQKYIKSWLIVTKRLFKFIFLSQTPSNYRILFVKLFVEILCNVSDYDLLFEIYSWLQTDNLDDVLFVYNFLEAFCDTIPNTLHEIKYNLCLCIIQTSIQLISYGYDPTCLLERLNNLLIICPCASEIVLLCITRTLIFCSSKFVLKIINFCSKVIQNYGCYKIVAQSVVASILQWNRTKLIDGKAINLFLTTANSDLIIPRLCNQNHKLCEFLTSDSFLLTSYSLIKLCPEFSNKEFISKWLLEINQTRDLLNDNQYNFFLTGLYLSKFGDSSQQKTILKLLNKKYLLALIAYALDQDTSHYNRFDLIKTIPTVACIQENTSLVINLIKRFENSNEEALNVLSIDMYYDLWMTESRCFRFLLYCLSKDKPGWQWNVVKLYTIKKIVKTNPNSDLVAILKQMLGFYVKRSMYLPLKLTMESLVDLCYTEYINPEVLLKMIDKNINNIHHPSVVSSYCDLLAIFANKTTENTKRLECFYKLWSMVLHPNDTTVKCALKSLSNVHFESMPLQVLPEKFQSFSKVITQLEDLEKIDLFNGPIPGECWVKFLQNISTSFINDAQLMLSVWLGQELEKNVISRIPSDHEPKNLKHLPDHSIGRGLMSFIVPKRKKMLDTDDDIKLVCLTIINKTEKSMYPFDWCFLEKYLMEGPRCKLWKESVILIAKQSTKSTSAFRLLYKCYDHWSSFDNNQIKLLFTILYKVSNIIYHNLQKQFVTNIVDRILNTIINNSHSNKNTDIDLLCYILSECKQILQSPETHMENVNFICNILENIWRTMHLENKEILHSYLNCCLALPVEVLKNLKLYPVQESTISKFIVLSCVENFIYSNVSFDAFNECIQVCNKYSKKNNILYDIIIELFKLKIFVPYHQEFIANFMIYLSSFTKQTNSFTNNSFNVQCSIFINLIVSLSCYGNLCMKDETQNYLVFPIALKTFLKDSFQSSRIVEWLKTMRTIQNLPEEYFRLFYYCLAVFKNDNYLLQWTDRKKIILL